MEITIKIDEEELKTLITEKLAKQLTAQYSTERNIFKREIAEATRKVIYAEKQFITDMVVSRATQEIKNKALPRLLNNLSKE